MREIKFRGKRMDNREWVYGYYVIDPKGRHRIYWKPFDEATSHTYHFVIPETVGQFTGLKDRNGKEIYEGDVICSKLKEKIISKGDIQFDCGVFGVEWTHHKEYKSFVGSWGQRHNLRKIDDEIIDMIEVIGNIHDNPELLTTK